MGLDLVRLQDVHTTPWRNGGGDTRMLLAWPDVEGWTVRISVAGIVRDGPFSAYPGVRRWFTVVEGAGVLLQFAAGPPRRCVLETPPVAFDGDDAPGCRLLDGPTLDLNLMLRAEAGVGLMRRATGLQEPSTLRAVYCADAVALHRGDAPADAIPAGSLAWSADAGDTAPWRLDANDATAGARCWWLAFDATPAGRNPPSSRATSASSSTPVPSP